MTAGRLVSRTATLLALSLLVAIASACSSASDDTVVIGDEQRELGGAEGLALARAEMASAPLTETSTDRVTPDGVTLATTAEYFEPATLGVWTAPDECAFNNRLTLEVDGTGWPSMPFEGPATPDDDGTSGFVGGVLPIGDSSLVLVAGYDHQAVLSLLTPDSESIDTQPADGWTALGLVVFGDLDEVEATITAEAADGTLTTTELLVPPVADGELAVLTPEWAFDLEAVGEQCEPPDGAEPSEPSPVDEPFTAGPSERPTLPEPGDQPDDPAAATAEVLESVRIVFDVVDEFSDEEQIARLELHPQTDTVVREVREQQVIEPFRSNLDPVFDSVVFAGPDEAAVMYRVGPSYSWEVGRVLLQEGSWRVALGTLCRDLADAGYSCPEVEHDPPPGPLGGSSIGFNDRSVPEGAVID